MKLFRGECLEVMKTLGDGVCDSLVTDPPAGISFMGKEWDSDKGGRTEWVNWMTAVMRECNRVMKPGAHGLVWALPRTSHWTATALEDAGFEVRDVLTHLFGQGFPKSLDISKAIDKAAGAEGPIIGKNPAYRERQLKHDAQWETAMRPEYKRGPATDAAKQWQGWGTALKPASEHWILVRKPCSEKTVAANVLTHGTGGINIDGSRIETDELKNKVYNNSGKDLTWGGTYGKGTVQGNSIGRFPANLVLSHTRYCTDDQCDIECAIQMLDAQSGISSSPSGTVTQGRRKTGGGFDRPCNAAHQGKGIGFGDTGGASRFFYCAKISAGERNAGLEDAVEARKMSAARPNSEDTTGKFPDHDGRVKVGNHHPTVKPQKLMRYLIKLVTPPGGTVLDPFMGSGSTGLAAAFEGFDFIGIERQQDYFEISEKRIFNTFPEFKKQTFAAGANVEKE